MHGSRRIQTLQSPFPRTKDARSDAETDQDPRIHRLAPVFLACLEPSASSPKSFFIPWIVLFWLKRVHKYMYARTFAARWVNLQFREVVKNSDCLQQPFKNAKPRRMLPCLFFPWIPWSYAWSISSLRIVVTRIVVTRIGNHKPYYYSILYIVNTSSPNVSNNTIGNQWFLSGSSSDTEFSHQGLEAEVF